jgi:hypothetical protein
MAAVLEAHLETQQVELSILAAVVVGVGTTAAQAAPVL